MTFRRYSVFACLALLGSVFSLTLVGCSETGDHVVERKHTLGHELYRQVLQPETMIVPDAIKYLRRTALTIENDTLAPGLYTPSEFAKAAAAPCEFNHGSMLLIRAIQARKVSNYKLEVDLDPLDRIPAELTPIESLSRQKNHPLFPTAEDRSSRFSECNPQLCNGRPEDLSCNPLFDSTPKPVLQDFEVFDLDYVIQVTATDRLRCCQQRADTNDTFLMAANAEESERKIDLASLEYSDSDMYRLITLLPVKYRGKSDSALALPNNLASFVTLQFVDDVERIRKTFANKQLNAMTLSFEQSTLLGRPRVGYGDWLQALSHPDGRVYVSPLLARAPFFLCFNNGPRKFLEAQWGLKKTLNVPRGGWRSLSEGDIIAVAKAHRSYDNTYRECINSQLFFLFAHELGHIVGHSDQDNGTVSEKQADCFAFVTTKRDTSFDLILFSKIFLAGKVEADNTLSKARLDNLNYLEHHFKGGGYPHSGEDTVAFCYAFGKQTTQQP